MQLSETTLYKNHGAKIGYWTATALATADGAEVRLTYAKSLDGKTVTKVDPIAGKNIGRANETTPQQQAQLELVSRVNKQLDKGYVRTIEEAAAPATNAMGLLKPMLAHPIDKVKPESIDWENAVAQPKLDGHRALFKDGVLYSRQGKPINLPHIVQAINESGLSHLHLDGEIYVHGEMLQDIGSLIKKPREESLALEYHVYDQVLDAPYTARHRRIEKEIECRARSAALRLVPFERVDSRDELTCFHEMILEQGYEGSILRHGATGYESDKRSGSLLKVKDFEDAEFMVLSYKMGTPYTQMAGDVVLAVYQVPVWTVDNGDGQTFEVTAQGNLHEKDAQARLAEYYVGKPLTVQFFGRSNKGIPLLPVALRWYAPL